MQNAKMEEEDEASVPRGGRLGLQRGLWVMPDSTLGQEGIISMKNDVECCGRSSQL